MVHGHKYNSRGTLSLCSVSIIILIKKILFLLIFFLFSLEFFISLKLNVKVDAVSRNTNTNNNIILETTISSLLSSSSSSSSSSIQQQQQKSATGAKNSILFEGSASIEDNLRKELIKAQILHRLGLSEKPQVDLAHKISKDLVLETLKRTETIDTTTAPTDIEILQTNTTNTHNSLLNINGRRKFNSNQTTTTKLLDDTDSDSLANYAKTSEIISFPDKGPVLNGETLLSFSFAGSNAFGVGVRVKKAHLWVKMDYRSSIGRHFGHLLHPKGITLYVFQVQGNFTQQSQPPLSLRTQEVSLDLVVSRTLSVDALGWQKFDVTQLVQKWYGKLSRHRIRHPHSHHHLKGRGLKLTLLLDCSGCGYSIHPVTFSHKQESESELETTSAVSHKMEDNGDNNNDFEVSSVRENKLEENIESKNLDHLSEVPFLVLETESTSPNVKRSRRRALECSPRVKQCCKQKFFVSFRELGWDDWIIAPRGYYANYCRGHCGGIHRTPDTFLNYHTHVMEEYRRTAAGQLELNGLTPCCSPTKFSAMSLIYFGPELNIIKRDLPKMIVEECGCP